MGKILSELQRINGTNYNELAVRLEEPFNGWSAIKVRVLKDGEETWPSVTEFFYVESEKYAENISKSGTDPVGAFDKTKAKAMAELDKLKDEYALATTVSLSKPENFSALQKTMESGLKFKKYAENLMKQNDLALVMHRSDLNSLMQPALISRFAMTEFLTSMKDKITQDPEKHKIIEQLGEKYPRFLKAEAIRVFGLSDLWKVNLEAQDEDYVTNITRDYLITPQDNISLILEKFKKTSTLASPTLIVLQGDNIVQGRDAAKIVFNALLNHGTESPAQIAELLKVVKKTNKGIKGEGRDYLIKSIDKFETKFNEIVKNVTAVEELLNNTSQRASETSKNIELLSKNIMELQNSRNELNSVKTDLNKFLKKTKTPNKLNDFLKKIDAKIEALNKNLRQAKSSNTERSESELKIQGQPILSQYHNKQETGRAKTPTPKVMEEENTTSPRQTRH